MMTTGFCRPSQSCAADARRHSLDAQSFILEDAVADWVLDIYIQDPAWTGFCAAL